MVQTCSAFGCVNVSKKNSGITFYKFPPIKRAAIREKWIHAMRRIGFQPGNNAKVCSNHFRPEDFPNRQNVHQLSICHNACFQSGSFPLPSLSQTQGSGGKKTADFLQFRHEALSSVACPIPLSLIHELVLHCIHEGKCLALGKLSSPLAMPPALLLLAPRRPIRGT